MCTVVHVWFVYLIVLCVICAVFIDVEDYLLISLRWSFTSCVQPGLLHIDFMQSCHFTVRSVHVVILQRLITTCTLIDVAVVHSVPSTVVAGEYISNSVFKPRGPDFCSRSAEQSNQLVPRQRCEYYCWSCFLFLCRLSLISWVTDGLSCCTGFQLPLFQSECCVLMGANSILLLWFMCLYCMCLSAV